jgi:hypothetical protein
VKNTSSLTPPRAGPHRHSALAERLLGSAADCLIVTYDRKGRGGNAGPQIGAL